MNGSRVAQPPAALLQAVETILSERMGRDSQRALGAAVRRVSLAYRREQGTPQDLAGDRAAIDARLAFFLPRDFPKLELPLRELHAIGALPYADRALRVLDLGAGLGTTGLCAALYLLGDEGPRARSVAIDAVEPDEAALRVARRLAQELHERHGLQLELRPHAQPLEQVLRDSGGERYDLITLGFVLNELGTSADAIADVLRALCARLTPDGSLIALEPALRETSRTLQAARDLLVAHEQAPYVVAPCLHRRPCPMLERERDWCHERIALPLPARQAELAREAVLRDEDLTFSYLTLRNEPRSLAQLGHKRPGEVALYRIVGGPLITKGKRELLVCGTGEARVLRRLDRHASAHNAAFDAASRGSVLALQAAADPAAGNGSIAIKPDHPLERLHGP